jgi:hypothetical protein
VIDGIGPTRYGNIVMKLSGREALFWKRTTSQHDRTIARFKPVCPKAESMLGNVYNPSVHFTEIQVDAVLEGIRPEQFPPG